LIKYIKNNQIDKIKWDNCVNSSFNTNIYVQSWYLDLVHDDWDALVEGDYERVMPLSLKTKYGITYYYQPFFTQQFGVFSASAISSIDIDNFIDNIPKHVKLIDANFNCSNVIDSNKHKVINNTNYILNLDNNYINIYAGYSKNTKRNIKKGAKNNLTFMLGVKPEALISLFKNNKGKEISNWDDSNYTVIQRIIYTSIHKGIGFTCGVYTEQNELCTAAFFIKNKNRLTFLFSGASSLARTNGAMPFLIDAIIQKNQNTNQILDFEGSNDINLARFYKGFGSQKTVYQRLKINRLNVIAKIVMKILK